MIDVPKEFKPPISVVYPPNNFIEFERWFGENYEGCNSDREYLGVYWTGYYVNNGYGQDKDALHSLQVFLNNLPRDKKYFTIVQYDDSILNNIDHLDVLQFNMSKNIGIPIPLICCPAGKKEEEKKYLASFIGSITHPIRQKMIEAFSGVNGCYISTKNHDYEMYNKILSQSLFALAPRGYGLASFRCYSEAVYQGAIPVYISDEHVIPFGINFDDIGIVVGEEDVCRLPEILQSISPNEIFRKQGNLERYYDMYFSYTGCLERIIEISKQ